jgi:hypothetical protein
MTNANAGTSETTERVAWGRYAWVAPLAIAAPIAVNLGLRALAKPLLNVPDEFMPFNVGTIVFLTTAGSVAAVLFFALLGWLSSRPFRLFNRIAVGALVLSWIPDILLLVFRPGPGITVPGVLSLMLMHLVTAAIVVGLLNTQARAR